MNMRRRGFVKTAGITLAVICVVNSSAGCSKKSVDYGIGDATEQTERRSGGNGKGLEQFVDASVWVDEWTAVNSKGNEVTVQVNADIVLPEAKRMSVVETRQAEFDSAFMERVTRGVFGSGDVYYNDVNHLPKEELIKMLEEEQRLYDLYTSDKTIEDPQMLESIKWMEENIRHYEELIKTAGETYIPAKDFEAPDYLGEIGGAPYELSFWSHETDEGTVDWGGFSLEAKNLRQYLSKEDIEETGVGIVGAMSVPCYPYDTGLGAVNNKCEMTEEEARKLVDNFVKECGLDYKVYAYTVPLVWGSNWEQAQDEKNCDGYVFYYDVGVDDISFVTPGKAEQYQNYQKKKESEPQRYSMNARMEVYVNDKGILYLNAQNPVEITGVSEDARFLALEDIQGVIKEEITEHFGDFRFHYSSEDWLIKFNQMELIYFRVRDKENNGHYSYVPAWRLGYVLNFEESNMKSIDNAVLINAIDGSVIDFYDEV